MRTLRAARGLLVWALIGVAILLEGCALTHTTASGESFGLYPGLAPAEDTIQTIDFTVVGVSIDATRQSLDVGYKAGRITSIPVRCEAAPGVPGVTSAKSVSGSLTGGTTITDTLTVGGSVP